jgi:hypothetical protein
MKEIPLINSKKRAKIDDDDFYLISKFEWYETPEGYAATFIEGVEVLMHDIIMLPRICKVAKQIDAE